MAGVFTLGKTAVLNSAPFFLTAVRLVPAGFLFLAGVYLFDRKNFTFKRKYWPTFAGIALFYFGMDSFRFVALQFIPSSHGALIACLSPFIAALMATFFFKEKFTTKKMFALCLGFIGVLPLIISNLGNGVENNSCLLLIVGYIIMFIAVISAVTGTFFLKKLIDVDKCSIYMSLGVALFFAGLISLIVSLLFETWNPIPVTDIATVLPIILFLFITHNLISQPLYGYLVKKYPVTLITFATLVTPVTTSALGFFLYGTNIGYPFGFALITLIIAFSIFYRQEDKEGLIH